MLSKSIYYLALILCYTNGIAFSLRRFKDGQCLLYIVLKFCIYCYTALQLDVSTEAKRVFTHARQVTVSPSGMAIFQFCTSLTPKTYRFETTTTVNFLGIIDSNKTAARILCLKIYKKHQQRRQKHFLNRVNAQQACVKLQNKMSRLMTRHVVCLLSLSRG